MERRFNHADYRAEMLPRVDFAKPKQQKVVDEETQAEIDMCLNCTRKKCDFRGECLKKQKDAAQNDKKKWTKKENDYLIKNYRKMRTEDIAVALSRTQDSVRVKARKLLKEKQNESNA